MGVDFFPCARCSETICDCGEYVSCKCGRSWCDLDCACEDGFVLDEDSKLDETCNFCREEDAEDSDLLDFLMTEHKLTRKKLLEMYFESKKKKPKRKKK